MSICLYDSACDDVRHRVQASAGAEPVSSEPGTLHRLLCGLASCSLLRSAILRSSSHNTRQSLHVHEYCPVSVCSTFRGMVRQSVGRGYVIVIDSRRKLCYLIDDVPSRGEVSNKRGLCTGR